MIVSIGDLAAVCRGCGGSDFTRAKPGELQLTTEFVCTGCGRTCFYQELLDSIGEQAIRRANESLTRLRTPRGRKPKK